MEHAAQVVDPFVFRLSIFVMAVFVGYYVVWAVTPALHTPLMSVTNAISSVIVVGALLAVGVALVGNDNGPIWARALGFVALVFASINIFGGFLVTQRMLAHVPEEKEVRTRHDELPISPRCSISSLASCSFWRCADCRARPRAGRAICSA